MKHNNYLNINVDFHPTKSKQYNGNSSPFILDELGVFNFKNKKLSKDYQET